MDIVSIARRERIIAIANVTPIIDVTGYSVDALRNIGAKSHRVATPISFESIRRVEFSIARQVSRIRWDRSKMGTSIH